MTFKERFVRFILFRYAVVLSYSGKGGQGKTLTADNLAERCAMAGLNVGLMDIDLEMNSSELSMGYDGAKVERDADKRRLKPVVHKKYPNLKMFSLSLMPFLEKNDQSICWGGEYQRQYIFQMAFEVDWDGIDIMIIDCPAGISNTIIALTNIYKKIDFGVITGLNNETSSRGVSKAITTLKENHIPILGVVANQSHFVCPHCKEISHPLGKGKVKGLCKTYDIKYLGGVPLSESTADGMDNGKSYVDCEAYDNMFAELMERIPKLKKKCKVKP